MNKLEKLILHTCRVNLLELQRSLYGMPYALSLRAFKRLTVARIATKEELRIVVARQRETWQRG